MEFGKVSGTVVLGILEGVVLGCYFGFQVIGGGFRDGFGYGMKGCIAGSLGEIGG